MNLETIKEFTKNTLAQALGIEVVLCEKGHVEATMPVDHRTHQPLGLLHGGASVALAETVASVGGHFLVMEKGQYVVGQEINANHLRSVKTGSVKAVGNVLHAGRTSQVWEIKIYDESQKDPGKSLVCVSRCTLAVLSP